MPALAATYLAPNGQIILPNLDCVKERIDSQHTHLSTWFRIEFLEIAERNLNPLYLATDDVEAELLKCPDNLTNETQMRTLYDFSSSPFYILTCINHVAPSTPSADRSKKSPSGPSPVGSLGNSVSSNSRNSSSKKRPIVVSPEYEETLVTVSSRRDRVNKRTLLQEMPISASAMLV